MLPLFWATEETLVCLWTSELWVLWSLAYETHICPLTQLTTPSPVLEPKPGTESQPQLFIGSQGVVMEIISLHG